MGTDTLNPKDNPNSIRYEIVVKGHLDPRWVHWFGGMTLTALPSGETRFCGALPDQSALHGIFNRIRDLGLTLMLVKRQQ